MPKKYILKCWIPIEGSPEFKTKEEAEKEKEHHELLQPKNIYEIVEFDDEVPF